MQVTERSIIEEIIDSKISAYGKVKLIEMYLLFGHDPFNWRSISEEFQVSRRTTFRYLAAMRKCKIISRKQERHNQPVEYKFS